METFVMSCSSKKSLETATKTQFRTDLPPRVFKLLRKPELCSLFWKTAIFSGKTVYSSESKWLCGNVAILQMDDMLLNKIFQRLLAAPLMFLWFYRTDNSSRRNTFKSHLIMSLLKSIHTRNKQGIISLAVDSNTFLSLTSTV